MITGHNVKITFKLERDEEGYPPADYETLWAEFVGDELYKIDNTPFFVRGISSGDIVSARDVDGVKYFDKLIAPSMNSTIRIVFYDKSKKDIIIKEIKNIGCYTEQSHIEGLISVEAPSPQVYLSILKYIKPLAENEILDFEEAAIR